MAMNPEVKAQWVKALRSGEYQQGIGQLREADRFCCLGVLCDLFAKQGGGEWEVVQAGIAQDFQRFDPREGHGSSFGLPQAAASWAGFETGSILVQAAGADRRNFIEALNDGAEGLTRHTFLQIADVIEVQL